VIGSHAYINGARKPSDVIRGYAILGRVIREFTGMPVLLFDPVAAARFDDLASRHLRVATMDLRIASIALARGLILLTRNVRDFGRVPGLVTEDRTS
jgi:tRNA(fMet)-specific endonuclease VapC